MKTYCEAKELSNTVLMAFATISNPSNHVSTISATISEVNKGEL